jgi:crotonobetainyl-CoA:carnitine CoA-transferase CaiB-like acyl-CoA transferase
VQGPLAGIRIVDLTINVLGPMATRMLGDMGADVIKVEPPAGDPMRMLGPQRANGMAAHFVNFNRSKRSVTLDLKSADALGRSCGWSNG